MIAHGRVFLPLYFFQTVLAGSRAFASPCQTNPDSVCDTAIDSETCQPGDAGGKDTEKEPIRLTGRRSKRPER
jgi:hypothetical protein